MDIAVVDTALTIAAAFLFARTLHQPFWLVFLILFVIGEILHMVMCVDTTVARLLK
jgi:succinate dehydrogenase hydrophobic anchor subunit